MPDLAPSLLAALSLAAPAAAEDLWLTLPDPAPMPEPAASGPIEVNGIAMHHALHGEADEGGPDPVLLIHGGLGHADLWSAQVADLMRDRLVAVADTRGHGRSTNDGTPYAYDVLADDYLALLDALGLDRVDVVGWSDGAIIGLDLAARHPERIDTLVAHAGNVTLEGIDPSVEEDAVFGAYVQAMAEDYAALSPTPGGFNAFLDGVARMWGTEKPGAVEALGAIEAPVVVLHSEHDEAILHDHAQLIADAIPSARLVVLPGVSHFAMLQAPEAYNAALRDALD